MIEAGAVEERHAVFDPDPNNSSVPRWWPSTLDVHPMRQWLRALSMIERRAEDRTCLYIPGMILVDEHRTVPCIIADRSATGIRVTLPNTETLPEVFILTFDDTGEALVCRAAWRKADQIGCIADVLVTAWLVKPALKPQVAWH